jgi:hypothetical protein
VSTDVRQAIKISQNFDKKMCQSHRNFEGFFIHCTKSNDYPGGCGNGFFVHSAAWLDSYHNRMGKKKPEESE